MQDCSAQTARGIAQQMLDKTGQAMMEGDIATFTACFRYPQELDTFEGRRWINSAEEMEVVLTRVLQHFRASGVTSMVRHVVDAAFRGETLIETTHETRLLNGDRLVQEPFVAFGHLERTGDTWQITFSQYAIADAPAHNAALHGKLPERATTE